MTSEVIHEMAVNAINALVPSSVRGVSLWLHKVKDAIGRRGTIVTLSAKDYGHALVPYYVQDMKDEARVYVYDANALELSSAATANAEVQKNELSPISTSMRLEHQ
jgi:hypothetical protein